MFPVERPELFDAVTLDDAGRVVEIRVKQPHPGTRWIWGAFKMPGHVFHQLHRLWLESRHRDEYIGTLVNAYLARGGRAVGVKAGEAHVDIGTLEGYRSAMLMLGDVDSMPVAHDKAAPEPARRELT